MSTITSYLDELPNWATTVKDKHVLFDTDAVISIIEYNAKTLCDKFKKLNVVFCLIHSVFVELQKTLRIVDFARFLKFDVSLPDALVQGMYEWVNPNAEWLRSIGVLPKEVQVPEDAPVFERLMGITGRQPK